VPNSAKKIVAMHQRICFFVAITFVIFGSLTSLAGQTQRRIDPKEPQKHVTGMLKSISNESISVLQAKDLNGGPNIKPADMTFLITLDTIVQGRERGHENATTTVTYVEQNGELIATNIYFKENNVSRYRGIAKTIRSYISMQ
jgi:hypothetical protein